MNSLDNRLAELGITAAMRSACRTPVCEEASDLVDAGTDMFGRSQRMTPQTRSAWLDMRAAAAADDIELKLVSAFRSVDYQCEVISRKLAAGRSIDEILRVNAIPGHSEHHSGRALDLHSGDAEPLEESFEKTAAFDWLSRHAARFGFHLSYPRDNQEGIDYEPWHWCYQADQSS